MTERYKEHINNLKDEDKKFCIGGDRGYPNILQPDEWDLLVTDTGREEVTKENKRSGKVIHFDKKFNKTRAVVERAIGRMKNHRLLSCGNLYTARSSLGVLEMKKWVMLSAIYTNKERRDLPHK